MKGIPVFIIRMMTGEFNISPKKNILKVLAQLFDFENSKESRENSITNECKRKKVRSIPSDLEESIIN